MPLLLLPALSLCAGLAGNADEQPAAAPQAAYERQIKPLFKQYCVNCHGNQNANAGVNLERYADIANDTEGCRHLAQGGDAPAGPQHAACGTPQPNEGQRDQLAAWVNRTLDSTDASEQPQNPGRILIHRLSRTEYNNTIRDLLGVDTHPADTFPADGGGGGGFDNNADTLFVPPILLERTSRLPARSWIRRSRGASSSGMRAAA